MTSSVAINQPTTAHSEPATGPQIGLLSDLSFTQLVNDALRNYQSTLALSRSPLANSPLVTPTLVKDEASPTAEERGQGLRLLLQWAVNQLAPAPPLYPLHHDRPLDDPTWRDPRWWRYNLLRHRYLEPLHPDDFVDGGRYTESLLALTGISSADAFFDERNRAIRAVAEQLRQQLLDGQASQELQRLALQAAMAPLARQSAALKLLEIAATFDDIFPRRLLIELAGQEPISHAEQALESLIAQRFLLAGDGAASLWLSPVLRAYVYGRQAKADSQRRHRLVAAYYEAQELPLPAARHWQRAQQDSRAVRVLLPVVADLVHELRIKELADFLQQLEPKRLQDDQWYTVQLLASDLFQRSGQQEEALAACRQALQATADPPRQARVYRRLGKLYESRNQLHALRYYQQAVELFAAADPEFIELLKDRGWIYFYRKEWAQAERDWQQAVQLVPEQAKALRADLYDAMSNLYRKLDDLNRALPYAERALAIREEEGDLLKIAKSHANLGLLYRTMAEYPHAIAAYQEAMTTYQKIDNQEVIAMLLLNVGVAHYLAGEKAKAIAVYEQSLGLAQQRGLPLIAIKARYNLAEAFAASQRLPEAVAQWQEGYQLARQHNFDDQEALFLALAPTLQLPVPHTDAAPSMTSAQPTTVLPLLEPDEQIVITIVKSEGSITPKRLMDAATISRATATRRLTALVEKGVLAVDGKGRGTAYYLAEQTPPTPMAPALSTETMQCTLLAHRAELAQQYGVTALGLMAQETGVPLLQFVVGFDPLPTVPAYRQLKRRLTQLLQQELDLLLEEEAPPNSTPLNWLWHGEA